MEDKVIGLNKDREAIYEEIYASQAGEPAKAEVKAEETQGKEEVKEVNDASVVKEETVEKTEEPVKEEPEQVEKVGEVKETEPIKEQKEEKLVPLEALHQERARIRKLKAEAQAREAELLKERDEILGTLHEYSRQRTEVEDYDYDQKLKILEDKLSRIESEAQNVGRVVRQSETEKEYNRVLDQIAETDKRLTEMGYPGFSYFKDRVVNEINLLPQGERIEANTNPEKWEKIYREVVYPEIASVFKIKPSMSLAEKESLKSQAKMLGEKRPESRKPAEDTWTIEDYFKSRTKGL